MSRLTRFSIAVRNNLTGLALLLVAWLALSLFFPGYILPSPGQVLQSSPAVLDAAFVPHLWLTLQRMLIGFLLAFGAGSVLGILAFILHLTEHLNSFMVALQVIPGAILGIILLLVLGVGDWTSIALVALLTLPTVAINIASALAKRDLSLEKYLLSAGAGRQRLVRHLYLPALVPTIQSNLSLGFGLGMKVVVLGEFIGSQDGLGYLLNVAAIRFDMQSVMAYLCVVLIISALFEIGQSLVFSLLLTKYFYPP